MPTLLKYALMTEPFPLLASPESGSSKTAKLTIVASNPNPEEPVTINNVSITLPIGSKASDLTIIVPDKTVPPKYWTGGKPTKGEGVVVYRFTPTAGHKEVGEQGLNFVFNDVLVNQQSGICRVEIEEVSPNYENLEVLQVAKFPPTWGEVKFGVDPANISAGEKTTLDWFGPADAEYKIEYSIPGKGVVWIPKQGMDPLANEGTYPGKGDPPLTPEVTTNFTLHVRMNISGRPYHAQQQRTVTVEPRPPSIEYFRPRNCDQSECVIYSDEFELEWKVLNAEPHQCQLTQEWKISPDKKVTQVIPMPWKDNFVVVRPIEKEVTYTLMVKDKNLEVTATVTATLIPPVPVGTIVPYGALLANQLPPGWLYCNGSEYVKDRYPQLYPVIQDVYGKSRSISNGVLPDLRGYFVRGYDDGRTVDPGRKMGSLQDDAFRSHTHGQKVTANPNTGACTRSDFNGDSKTYSEYDQGVQTYSTGDTETRPKNLATYFVIYAGVFKSGVGAKDAKKSKKDQTKSKKSAAGGGRGRLAGRRGAR